MNKYLNIVSFWVDELVNDKEKYNITSEENGKNITIFVDVEEDYIGKVIGKNGNIITSIRNLINSISKVDKKNIKIIVKGI
ncbi:KH domain-containing protein [Sneathia sanguinegens]|uniref:KH domain-containing protein n=1 Tax=Sneathia sanguinegens TaxID=40543 RepID=UPI0023F80BA4|nr:KH domain-containing protein [Sneathia sanguinegens]